MSRAQRLVLIVGLVAFVAAISFPAWKFSDQYGGYSETSIRTYPFWRLPSGNGDVDLAVGVILLRLGAVAGATAAAWLVAGLMARSKS